MKLVRKLAVLVLACVAGVSGAVAPPAAVASAANCSPADLPVSSPSVVSLLTCS